MDKLTFTAKVYEILDKGLIEVNGKLYYSEDAVMSAMEWLHANMGAAVEVDASKILSNLLNQIAEPYK